MSYTSPADHYATLRRTAGFPINYGPTSTPCSSPVPKPKVQSRVRRWLKNMCTRSARSEPNTSPPSSHQESSRCGLRTFLPTYPRFRAREAHFEAPQPMASTTAAGPLAEEDWTDPDFVDRMAMREWWFLRQGLAEDEVFVPRAGRFYEHI